MLDFVAIFAVQDQTGRHAHSAMPQAPVQPEPARRETRWHHAVLRLRERLAPRGARSRPRLSEQRGARDAASQSA